MARLSLHLSKCHIVGNHMARLILPQCSSSSPNIHCAVPSHTNRSARQKLFEHLKYPGGQSHDSTIQNNN